MRVSRDLLRDGEIIIANITKSAGKGRKYRHQKCEICSQLGNVLSPTWEHFIPKLGTLRSTNGNCHFFAFLLHIILWIANKCVPLLPKEISLPIIKRLNV